MEGAVGSGRPPLSLSAGLALALLTAAALLRAPAAGWPLAHDEVLLAALLWTHPLGLALWAYGIAYDPDPIEAHLEADGGALVVAVDPTGFRFLRRSRSAFAETRSP